MPVIPVFLARPRGRQVFTLFLIISAPDQATIRALYARLELCRLATCERQARSECVSVTKGAAGLPMLLFCAPICCGDNRFYGSGLYCPSHAAVACAARICADINGDRQRCVEARGAGSFINSAMELFVGVCYFVVINFRCWWCVVAHIASELVKLFLLLLRCQCRCPTHCIAFEHLS